MQCPHCHADNQEGRFCGKCGKPLDQDASDLTRVMPPLSELHETPPESTSDDDNKEAAVDALEKALDDAEQAESNENAAADAPATPETDEPSAESTETDLTTDTENPDTDEQSDHTLPKPPAFLMEDDELADDDALREDTDGQDRRKKILTAVSLIIGIILAAVAAIYLFTDVFDTTPPTDPSEQVKNADTVAPDTSLAEDTIVGHWRHYNTGSVIEKIGTARYRWTIGKKVYQLDFKDNQYVYKDENGNVYNFVLTDADHIQLASSSDSSGGLITDPVFESGYTAGRVGQDGTMAESMSVNTDAFNIVGKTYAELAGTYGPGALSVIGDNQYIIFRGDGGNFAVQFEGETVPLSAKSSGEYTVKPLSTNTASYSVSRLTQSNTVPYTDSTTPSGGTTDTGNNDNTGSTTTDGSTGSTTNNNNNNTTQNQNNNNKEDETTEYKVEIPDMPTFPSTTAVATGVVWADLGFVIKNAPDTMSVNDLSAVLGIALEVGTAPANQSGFNFYGSDEGYFAGTYAINDHSFSISGYGSSALNPSKTILFIQQIS